MSPFVTKAVVIAVFIFLCLYNVAAVYYGGEESSISFVIARWTASNPIVAVVAGILIGHWFWNI